MKSMKWKIFKFSQLQLVVRDMVNQLHHILNNKLLVCINWTVLHFKCYYTSLTELQVNSLEQYFTSKWSARWDSPIWGVLRTTTISFQLVAQFPNRSLRALHRQSPGSECLVQMSLTLQKQPCWNNPHECHHRVLFAGVCVETTFVSHFMCYFYTARAI